MRMSQETYKNLNNLVGRCFNANAVVDNLAYCLDYHYFNEIAKIVHLRVAHLLPELADEITDKMLELSARPIRVDIRGYDADYENLPDIFGVLSKELRSILEEVRRMIGNADMNGDDEVRIFLEEFLGKISLLVKQAEEWENAAGAMDAHTLNVHFKDYTHWIKI